MFYAASFNNEYMFDILQDPRGAAVLRAAVRLRVKEARDRECTGHDARGHADPGPDAFHVRGRAAQPDRALPQYLVQAGADL